MIRTINIANIRLTTPIKAADKDENKTTIYTKAVEGVYTKKLNNIKETREQDFSKKDTISIIN
jgi:hypothetical protein